MDTLTPVFVFRHPALMVPSLYRGANSISGWEPGDEDFEISTTLRWNQYLYDYFVARGRRPAVIEAQDFVYNTRPIMDKLCRHLGIDESGWSEKWHPLPKEHWPDHKIAMAMTGDAMASSGLERRAKGVSVAPLLSNAVSILTVEEPVESTLDLDTETENWRAQWGDKIAQGMRTRVDAEMPTYEYLKSVKLRA